MADTKYRKDRWGAVRCKHFEHCQQYTCNLGGECNKCLDAMAPLSSRTMLQTATASMHRAAHRLRRERSQS